jgi:hypothetical protein
VALIVAACVVWCVHRLLSTYRFRAGSPAAEAATSSEWLVRWPSPPYRDVIELVHISKKIGTNKIS